MVALSTSPEDAQAFEASLAADLTWAALGAEAAPLGKMLPAVYDDLRRVAAGYLRDERPDHTLQPTALVHEAYLRMANQRQSAWQNRAHLLGIFARMMRRILFDHASARVAAKRGGQDALRVTLDDALEIYSHHNVDLLAVDEALRKLEGIDPVQGKIVEMRFFGGLTAEEISKVLEISPTSVKREWAVAKRWLRRALSVAN